MERVSNPVTPWHRARVCDGKLRRVVCELFASVRKFRTHLVDLGCPGGLATFSAQPPAGDDHLRNDPLSAVIRVTATSDDARIAGAVALRAASVGVSLGMVG